MVKIVFHGFSRRLKLQSNNNWLTLQLTKDLVEMKYQIAEGFASHVEELKKIVLDFKKIGEVLVKGNRNTIKTVPLSNGTVLNIKSFKKPNIINQIAYRFFRKSKARRSFEYAQYLQKAGIGTPQPIAFFEDPDALSFNESFYICEHLDYDFMYRDVVSYDQIFEDRDAILKAFTQFTYKLHENEVEFLDHSPGNTLIKRTPQGCDFYLVDLNRMNIGPLSFQNRIKNFAKLTHREDVMKIMSDEYAQLSGSNPKEVFQTMMYYNKLFQYRWHRKEVRKKKWEKG